MIEFRWVVLLALWTLLIGPVVDLAQHAPTASQPKSAAVKTLPVRSSTHPR